MLSLVRTLLLICLAGFVPLLISEAVIRRVDERGSERRHRPLFILGIVCAVPLLFAERILAGVAAGNPPAAPGAVLPAVVTALPEALLVSLVLLLWFLWHRRHNPPAFLACAVALAMGLAAGQAFFFFYVGEGGDIAIFVWSTLRMVKHLLVAAALGGLVWAAMTGARWRLALIPAGVLFAVLVNSGLTALTG